MTRATLTLMAVILWPAPAAAEPSAVTGWASAYAPGVMAEVVTYRNAYDLWRNPLPHDWYTAAGYIATNDCSQVGQMLTLIDPDGRAYRVLVADCGGRDGGSEWMTDHDIIAELDYALWQTLTARHGRPLRVELR